MALGSSQTTTITSAATGCTSALKSMGRHRLRASSAKALAGKEPEKVMAQLVDISFKASVSKISAAAGEAFTALQYHYQRVLDAWHASPSDANRKQMVQLFHRVLKK
jgi:hypothetical protein